MQKTQVALLKRPVQFYSAFTRSYDAVAYYAVDTTGIAKPAVLGVDYNIVDKDGNVIQPDNGIYTITFPRAERKMDTIYVKLLNNPLSGTLPILGALLRTRLFGSFLVWNTPSNAR